MLFPFFFITPVDFVDARGATSKGSDKDPYVLIAKYNSGWRWSYGVSRARLEKMLANPFFQLRSHTHQYKGELPIVPMSKAQVLRVLGTLISQQLYYNQCTSLLGSLSTNDEEELKKLVMDYDEVMKTVPNDATLLSGNVYNHVRASETTTVSIPRQAALAKSGVLMTQGNYYTIQGSRNKDLYTLKTFRARSTTVGGEAMGSALGSLLIKGAEQVSANPVPRQRITEVKLTTDNKVVIITEHPEQKKVEA